MTNTTDKVREIIKENWDFTNETPNTIHFRYGKMRGEPKFIYKKDLEKVNLVDKTLDSRKEALSVEVKTTIYSQIKEGVEVIDAQKVFLERNTEEMKKIIEQYGGAND
ncbi:hypothetical protein ACQUY5_26820 [Bacillus cereus]|uniref:hypothetical protein n=1 Tax=Bacillus cereus TaxID=1396 RepID=UPI003D16FC03